MTYAFDIDGTLIPQSSNSLDERILQLLFELSISNKVIFASARPMKGIKNLIPSEFQKYFDYVSLNGAYSIINNKEYISESFSRDETKILIENFANQNLWLYSKDKWFSTDMESKFYNKESQAVLMEAVPMKELSEEIEILKAIIISKDKKTLNTSLFSNFDVTYSNKNYIEINTKGVNKAFFLNKSLIDPQTLCFFGDSGNDIPLLEVSKFAITMASQNEKLISISHYNTINKYYSGIKEGLNFINVNK